MHFCKSGLEKCRGRACRVQAVGCGCSTLSRRSIAGDMGCNYRTSTVEKST
jgi:hypothetical protein